MRRSLNSLKSLARGRARRAFTLLALVVLLGFAPTLVGGGAPAQAATKADMAITSVTSKPDTVFVNQSVTYVVGAVDLGPDQATGVELTTALPSGVSFVPLQSNPACTESGGIVTCSFSSWDVGAAGLILITVTPSTAGVLQLTFTVTATERDPDLSNNSQTGTTTVLQPTNADVSIHLPSSAAGYAGQNIFLSVQVGNAGPATATGVTATLQFPPGLSPNNGGVCTATGVGLSCTYLLGTVPAGTGIADIIGLTATTAGSYTVQGSVTADQPDPVLSNNSASTLVTVTPAADLSAQLAGPASPAAPGSAITYTVTVTNNGPSPASAVALTDSWSTTVAGGVQLLSFAAAQGQCALTNNQQIDCQLGGLPSDATTTVTLTMRARGTGSVTDQAQDSAAELDPNTANNADSQTTTIGPA